MARSRDAESGKFEQEGCQLEGGLVVGGIEGVCPLEQVVCRVEVSLRLGAQGFEENIVGLCGVLARRASLSTPCEGDPRCGEEYAQEYG